MLKLKYLSSLLCIILFISACGDQRVLENLGLIQATGYDLLSEDEDVDKAKEKLIISISLPRSGLNGEEMENEFSSTTALTSKEGRAKLARQSEYILVSGQMRNAVFGLSLAKDGLWEHIDTLVRDPSISPRVRVSIVEGSAHDLLKKNYPTHPRTGKYLDNLLKTEAIAKAIPATNIYRFTRDYLDDGVDPIVPIIKELDGHITIDGIALFRDDRYITKIEPDKALIFSFLYENFKQGEISINLKEISEESEHVMLSSLNSKRDIKVTSNLEKNHFTVDISLNIKGAILEYVGDLRLANDKDIKELEGIVSQYVNEQAKIMIKEMQKNNVDSLGMGKYVRNSLTYNQWSNLVWHDHYPNVEVLCNTKVSIKDYGKFGN